MIIDDNKVYTLKLTTGEEIITRIQMPGSSDSHYTITEPLTAMITQKGVQFAPSLFTSEQGAEIELNMSAVVMITPARDDISLHYIEAITGIKPVTNKVLLG